MNTLRLTQLGASVLVMLAITGCANRWQRPVEADGRFCYVFGKKRESICTTQVVPSAAADLEVKRFLPDPNALTVYVVRHRWMDGFVYAAVSADAAPRVNTVPESLVRLRLSPGRHQLTASWQGRTVSQGIDGNAGDVRFIELVGTSWAWDTRFAWNTPDAEEAKRLALKSRLVADLVIR